MAEFQRSSYAPIHRGVYELARESTDAFEGARTRIAQFVGWDPACSIFTRNATEAINLVAYSWGRANIGPGDEVLITEMEHHSNIVPWQILCEATRRTPALPDADRGRRAVARRARRRPRGGTREARRVRAHLERARHDQPGRGDRLASSRRGRGDRRRRRAGRAPAAGRPERAGRRLLRLDGTQGARPDDRDAAWARGSCSRRCRRSSAAVT